MQKGISKILVLVIAVVILAAAGGFFAWQKIKQPTEQGSDLERTEQLKVSSSLNADDVMAQFVPYMLPWGEKITKRGSFWEDFTNPNDGFVKGYGTAWYGEAYWIKKDETEIKGPDDGFGFILGLDILKYSNHESAQKDYMSMSVKQDFADYSVKNIQLKAKVGIPLSVAEEFASMNLEPQQYQQYFILADDFIVFMYGSKEAADDAVIRFIDHFGE